MSENIDYIYDEITEIENENETLKKDNEQLESKLNSNKQNIIEAQQKLEQIMKDLIDAGGFQKEETAELQMLYKIIEDSNNESNRIKMNKCLDLLINFTITDDGIKDLTNLKKLYTNYNITNYGIKKLTNLKKIKFNSSITHSGIQHLTNIQNFY